MYRSAHYLLLDCSCVGERYYVKWVVYEAGVTIQSAVGDGECSSVPTLVQDTVGGESEVGDGATSQKRDSRSSLASDSTPGEEVCGYGGTASVDQ